MVQAKNGDRVKVHYTLMINEGEVFESSHGKAPLEFTIGNGEMLQDFETGVVGLAPGESKAITISADNAYGAYDERRIFEFEKKNAPQDFDPHLGQVVRMFRPDGKPVIVTVIGMTENGFTFDANHPLAGKELRFDITLLEIKG